MKLEMKVFCSLHPQPIFPLHKRQSLLTPFHLSSLKKIFACICILHVYTFKILPKWDHGGFKTLTLNSLTFIPSKRRIYFPSLWIWAPWLLDQQNMVEVMLCQVLGPGLKKLEASTSYVLRCLFLEPSPMLWGSRETT